MSANGAPAPTSAPSFENFSFSFSKPSLLSRLNMSAQAVEPEPSPSTGSTSAVTTTTDILAPEPTTSGASFDSNTRFSSITQPDQDMTPEEDHATVSQDTSRNGLDRDSSTLRAGSPIAMEIDNGEPGMVEIPSSHSAGGSRIPPSYRDLPVNHYFVAPPAALAYPRSPVRKFPEGHSLHTQPSLFGHLPRAPPRSPRLSPLEILELESARERSEWEQVCSDLGRPRLGRLSTVAGPSQPHSVAPSVPQIQTQINGNKKTATSQAPPSEDDYDSDSSDVELRIYNADSVEDTQTPSQPNSALGTVPPTPLGARPPVTQSLTVPNGVGFAAHRVVIERLSQGPSTPRVSGSAPEAAADRPSTPPQSSKTTPVKRKIDDVDQVAQESSAKRKSPALQEQPTPERTGVPPPLRSQVDRTPAPVPKSTLPQAPATTEATSQATTPQAIAISSSSTHVAPRARSGNICRFHNRPPGRVCVRKDQCPDLHIGELQKSTPGGSPGPSPAIEPPSFSSGPPKTVVAPPVIAPPLARTPSLASAPPLGTNPSPPPRPTRPPCRFFSKPGGCARGVDCLFGHSNEQTSRPPSRQLAPSPIPAISAPAPTLAPTVTAAPIAARIGPKVPLPATAPSLGLAPATAGPSVPAPATVAPSIPAPTPIVPFVPAPAPSIFTPTPAPPRHHPLPPKPATSPKVNTSQAKGKKAKAKAAQAAQAAQTSVGPSSPNKPSAPSNANANKPGGSANVQVKIEQDVTTPNTKAVKRKASGSQPKPQPARLNTGAREIKQEEVTLYDLADDSPQEPSGSSVLLPELTQSQPRTGIPQAQAQPRTEAPQGQAQGQTRPEVVQSQARPMAPLPARAVPSTAPTTAPLTSTVLPPLNRPPPPPYRPVPPSNPNPSPSSQAPPAPVLMPAAPLAPAAPPAPTVPVTAVIPPTPVRPVPEQSAPKVPAGSASNGPATDTPQTSAANAPKPPVTNGATTQATNAPKPSAPAPTVSTDKLTIPVPPRSNPSPAPPRLDMAPDSSPPQAQTQPRPRSRQTSREPARPDNRGLARRMSPVRRDTRDPPRRNSREPENRSLVTRIDHRSNPGGSSYRPPRSRSPPRGHYSPPPPRRRSPPRGRSPSPVRYRDWRSRSRSPVHRPLRERFIPRAIPPRPGRSPYRSPSSPSRSVSRSPSRSPRRQQYEPRPSVDGYTNGSAYFPAEKNIPRTWESEAGGSRPVQNEGYDSSPRETMVIDEQIHNSTPPPRNATTAPNEYDSFNQSRMMDISPMSSPARGYVSGGLGNRISDHSPHAANDYPPPMANSYALPPPPEQRENLLTRMIAEPDLANRLSPAGSSTRAPAPTRAQPANKPTKTQQPLANRLGGGDSYPSQASRNDRRPPPPRDTGVRGGKLMSRMMGQ